MEDQTDKYLAQIEKHKIPGLDLRDDLHPAYHGLSLLNLPASICRWLHAPELPHPPLQIPELTQVVDGMDQMIVVLLDALSFARFREWSFSDPLLKNSALGEGFIFPLTSVVPSTTSTVLTTLWTGRSPGEHGVLGYELFLRKYAMVVNMITHSPATFNRRAGMLYQAGFNPETALPVPSLGTQLTDAGITTFALLARNITRSGLSRMHYPDVEVYGYSTVSDLWHLAEQLVNLPIKSKRFIWIYYGAVDTLSHRYGPDSDQVKTEFVSFLRSMNEVFIDAISDDIRRRSVVFLTSDHGQKATPPNPHFDLSNHPSFTNRLHLLPTGENRFSYLHPRPGQRDAIVEYVQRTWPNSFYHLDSHYALDSGLFGPGTPMNETRHRIGDQIIVSREANYLWGSSEVNSLLGRHGGLSFDEMIVPFYVAPL